jgi:hypothetical protein
LVKLYDLSDTEGTPFKVPQLPTPQGTARDIADLEDKLLRWMRGREIEVITGLRDINEPAYGATNGVRIWLAPDLDPTQRLATLAHEIGHVKLHYRVLRKGEGLTFVELRGDTHSKDRRELQAELTAFFLLATHGIDSTAASGTYLATWRASQRVIKDEAQRCLKAALSVLTEAERGRRR